ncbi:hypothetical protein POTOM_006363 [Populus tomentosa]|uniref:Secreted protein n=1 Tax=Populus tomentosa TaxID=118781 RepID=A0A8X8AN21_POPTO|nr:hypothetical protein POTOM_006363 [Populus tomentosa]
MGFFVTTLIFVVIGIIASLCTRICCNRGPSTNLFSCGIDEQNGGFHVLFYSSISCENPRLMAPPDVGPNSNSLLLDDLLACFHKFRSDYTITGFHEDVAKP